MDANEQLVELIDACIICHRQLAKWEQNRSECLDCRDIAVETYTDN